nr:hypothetical protein [uncultured Sphingomonas sp.]
MTYSATAIEVMIASPSDVVRERQIVKDVLAEWNAMHSRREKICLMAIGWETHSSPELSGRAQELINERVLKHADILVGIFWTRVGSPTGKSISGSIEEIERHRESGKPVMLYFSTAPVSVTNLDTKQIEELEKFKAWARGEGLIETFEDTLDFANKFRSQLQFALNANNHLGGALAGDAPDFVEIFERSLGSQAPSNNPSEDASSLLVAAAIDPNGYIMVHSSLGGTSVQAGSKEFAMESDRRSAARWIAAAEQLQQLGLVRDVNGKGEIFEVTHRGFEFADRSQTS